MHRRDFIRCSLCSLMALRAYSPRVAFAAGNAGNGKNLILINQVGGIDTLFAHPLRGSVAGILQPLRPDLFIDPALTLPLNNDLGLHPLWSPLHSLLFSRGDIKAVTMVGNPDEPGSHNTAQLQQSQGALDAPVGAAQGWVARVMDQYMLDMYQVWGIGVPNKVDFRTQGSVTPLLVDTLADFKVQNRVASLGGANETDHTNEIFNALVQLEQPQSYAESKLRDGYLGMQGAMTQVSQIAQVGGLIGNYPQQSEFGNAVQDVARILKHKQLTAATGSTIISLQRGQFDTHGTQLQVLPGLIDDLALSLRALIDDLITMGVWNDTVICMYSEFGRTTRQNGPDIMTGSDHGGSTTMLLLGGGLNHSGSAVVGPIPSTSDIINHNKMPMGIDFRNVFAEMVRFVGFDPELIFTSPYQKLNLQLV